MSKLNKKDVTIVIGNFNAILGHDNQHTESIMGVHGMAVKNDNGKRLFDFCLDKNLVIGDTPFKHKTCHKVTWVSPDAT